MQSSSTAGTVPVKGQKQVALSGKGTLEVCVYKGSQQKLALT